MGVYDLKVDEWGLDVVVSGSQKSFSLPPGLSMVSVSEKAWRFAEAAKCPRYYFNLLKERKALGKQTTSYTSSVSLIIGLGEVLRQFKEMGLEALFAHHRRLSEGVKTAVAAMGLELFPKDASEAITVINAPEGIDGTEVVKILREEYGITIAGGQAHLKGKVFRISHYGHLSEWDMIIAISAIERALNQLGYKIKFGAGVAAAEEYFASH
jgi:aspartate aminotransferase-like enzyme